MPAEPAPPPLECDVAALRRDDLDTVDAIARLALTARRMGCRLVLRNVPDALAAVLRRVGLAAAPGGSGGVLVLQVEGQAELGEDGVGVDEEGHPDDRAV